MLLPVEKDDKWAYINENGELLTDFSFNYAAYFFEDIALVRLNDGKKVAINKNFEKLFEIPGESYLCYSEGILQFRQKDKAGYLDKNGNIVIPPQFDSARNFENGYASVEKKEKWGLIDKTGKQVLLPVFDFLGTVAEDGIFTCAIRIGKSERMYGLINVKSEIIIKPKYNHSHGYNEGLICYRDDNYKYGYMDINENWIIKPQYDDATIMKNGMAAVGINDKWGIINKNGEWIIKPVYTWARSFREGLAAVYVGGKWDYEYPLGGKWGFINMNGDMVIPAIFDEVEAFKNGVCRVEIGDVAGDVDFIYSTGYIDKSGKYIWKPSR